SRAEAPVARAAVPAPPETGRRFAPEPLARPLSVLAGASRTAPAAPPPRCPPSKPARSTPRSSAPTPRPPVPVLPRRLLAGRASRPPSATHRRSVTHLACQAKHFL